MASELQIRLLGPDEPKEVFAQMAVLHAQEIAGGFLTSLGPKFLTRLYRLIQASPNAFTLVATHDGAIVAFLCGTLETKKVYKDVFRKGWPVLSLALARKVFSLATVKRIWETLRYPAKAEAPDIDLPKPEILNFCVANTLQRSGIGSRLFAAMETEFRNRGIREIRIVTGDQQTSAIRFYEKRGATPAAKIEIHEHVGSRIFRYSIRDCQP